MSKSRQVVIASDHFRDKSRSTDRCTASQRRISYVADSPLRGMSEVPHTVSHCLQSL